MSTTTWGNPDGTPLPMLGPTPAEKQARKEKLLSVMVGENPPAEAVKLATDRWPNYDTDPDHGRAIVVYVQGYKAAATPATLPPFYKEGDAAAAVSDEVLDKLEALQNKAVAAFEEWDAAGTNSTLDESDGADIALGREAAAHLPALIAEIKRLRATPAPVLSLVEEAGPPPEVVGYHSTELSDISSIITWLHAQNKPMGELLRRFYNDATRGKAIKEYNDLNPLPATHD